jgi:5-hydroxytryptamine receptor 1
MRIFYNAVVKLESKLTAEQVLFSVVETASGVREGNPSIISQDPEIILPAVVHHRMDTDDRDQHSHLPSHSRNNQDDTESFPRMPGRSKISRLEVQAALNLSVNILPFWLCTFPVSCYAIVTYWCIQLDVNLETIVVTWNYFWDTFMLHSIYNPIMYMATCLEFRRALRHTVKKLSTKFRFALRK